MVGLDCPWEWGPLPSRELRGRGPGQVQIPKVVIRGLLLPDEEASSGQVEVSL